MRTVAAELDQSRNLAIPCLVSCEQAPGSSGEVPVCKSQCHMPSGACEGGGILALHIQGHHRGKIKLECH